MNGQLSEFSKKLEVAEHALKQRKFETAADLLHDTARYASSNAEVARAKRALGYAYRMLGYLPSAQTELESAEEISSTASDSLSVGIAQRLLAEVLYDRAVQERDVQISEDLFDECATMINNSLFNLREAGDAMDVFEYAATLSMSGAMQCELGNTQRGVSLLDNSVIDEYVTENEHILVRNVLRHMRYVPIDRLRSVKSVWMLSKRDPALRSYRPLALKALIGLKVHL